MAVDVNTAVEVAEQATVPANDGTIIENVLARVSELLATYGLKVIAGLLILIVGLWVSRRIARCVRKHLENSKIDTTLVSFIYNLCNVALIIFVVMAALSTAGIETTSFIAVLGAAGLAVGFALQGSLSNFAAGVLLIIFKPYRIGDFVEISGKVGTVVDLQIFNTILNSPDNLKVIIPNSHATSDSITNFTVNGNRRVDLVIGISYGDDIKKAKQVISEVLLGADKVLAEPAPTVAVKELADSSVNFVVRPWCNSADYWDVYFGITEQVKLALDANDITIPFPQRDVHMINEK